MSVSANTPPGVPPCVRAGFTLVELLVVLAVIATLAGLFLPAAQRAREAARMTACRNNLKQIALGLHNYESTYGCFPLGCRECFPQEFPIPAGFTFKQWSWNVALLPFLEQAAVRDRFDNDAAYSAASNLDAAGVVLPVFLCPTTPGHLRGETSGDVNDNGTYDPGDDLAFTDYGGLFGVSFNTPTILPEHEGVLLYDRVVRVADIPDGLSNTAAVGECTGRDQSANAEWANGQNLFDHRFDQPINFTRNNELFSDHVGGAFVAFADGHAAFLSETLDQGVLISLLTRAGGEIAP